MTFDHEFRLAPWLVALLLWPSSARAQADIAGSASAPSKPEAATLPSKQPDLDLLTFYKDNYFLTGFTDATEAKFQFSAKFDVWPNRGPHAVYFAFTQKSLWDVFRTSQPFVENNYAPELFYSYFHAPGRYDPKPGCGFFMERVGAVHESNGEVGARSRAWNRIYVESRFACYDARRDFGSVNLQLWGPPLGVADNPNIRAYLGYGELSLSVGADNGQDWLGDWEFALHARKGTGSWGAGSLEADARWRPRYGDFWRFTPYLYGQWFTGYGETLLSYDSPHSAIRVGVGFTDRSTRTQ